MLEPNNSTVAVTLIPNAHEMEESQTHTVRYIPHSPESVNTVRYSHHTIMQISQSQ